MLGDIQVEGNSGWIVLVTNGLPYLTDNIVEGDGVEMELRSAREGEQLTDETTDPSDLGNNNVEELSIVLALGLAFEELFRPHLNDIQGSANFVGQAGGELTQRCQFFGVTQFAF